MAKTAVTHEWMLEAGFEFEDEWYTIKLPEVDGWSQPTLEFWPTDAQSQEDFELSGVVTADITLGQNNAECCGVYGDCFCCKHSRVHFSRCEWAREEVVRYCEFFGVVLCEPA